MVINETSRSYAVISNSRYDDQLLFLSNIIVGIKRPCFSSLPPSLPKVRDLVSWMHDMGALLLADEPARSASGAEALLTKHNEHKAEIDAREDSVAQVTKVGRRLTQQGHYASSEVKPGACIVSSTMYHLTVGYY